MQFTFRSAQNIRLSSTAASKENHNSPLYHPERSGVEGLSGKSRGELWLALLAVDDSLQFVQIDPRRAQKSMACAG